MVYLLLYLLLETLISVEIASKIGSLATFLEIVISGVVGLFLLTKFKYTLANNVMMLFSKEIDIDQFQRDSIFAFLGAILLIIPGFFSDILGILFQFSSIVGYFRRKIFGFKSKKSYKTYCKGDINDEIIDVEIVDEHKSISK